jgi:branched-subunit amino acid aminotransferase/4-amino-4-deoxychorismate lyase
MNRLYGVNHLLCQNWNLVVSFVSVNLELILQLKIPLGCRNSLFKIRQRQYIEKVKPIGIDEMILIKDSNLYEGLVTNFFAVVEDEDGALAVITAPFDFVLPGIIAQAIVDMLSKSCIHFRFEFPDLKRHKWKGAFLTNANRWIQPVHSIATLQQEFHTFDHFEFILKMQSNLYTYLHDRGTKL